VIASEGEIFSIPIDITEVKLMEFQAKYDIDLLLHRKIMLSDSALKRPKRYRYVILVTDSVEPP